MLIIGSPGARHATGLHYNISGGWLGLYNMLPRDNNYKC